MGENAEKFLKEGWTRTYPNRRSYLVPLRLVQPYFRFRDQTVHREIPQDLKRYRKDFKRLAE